MTGSPTGGSAPAGGRYGFLRESRWIGLIITSIVACLVCVWLGTWQLDRHGEKVERRDQVALAEDTAPVPAADLLGDLVVDPADTWRRVTVTGTYVDGATLGLRNRPVAGTTAVHVVDLLATELDGRDVLLPVDRGWVPAAVDLDPTDLPAPPAGEVTLTLQLRTAERTSDRTPAPGWLYAVEEGALRGALGALPDPTPQVAGIAGGAGVVVAGFGEPLGAPDPGLSGFPTPDVSLGNHLSYVFQWWIFAAGSLLVVPLLARREADEADEALLAGTPYARGGELAARPSAKVTDADEEDAWLDAAESGSAPTPGQGPGPVPDAGARAGGQASVTRSR